MNTIKHLFIGLLLITTFGCNSDDDSSNNNIPFYWNQTKCADPWDTGENDPNEETKNAVKVYLENENIIVKNLNFDNKSPLDTLCESCACGTGQRIIVEVIDSDSAKMEAIGFYK